MGVRVHALEGSMVSTLAGVEKLIEIYKSGKEDCQIFVLSPVRSPELSLEILLKEAERRMRDFGQSLNKANPIGLSFWKILYLVRSLIELRLISMRLFLI